MSVADWRRRWYLLSAGIVVFDQITKWLVLAVMLPGESRYVAPFWNWVLTFNPGAAFSFLADQPGWQRWFFTLLALAVSAWVARELYRHPQQKMNALALSLVMGGALGNVIDRIRFGAVVDFIQWHAGAYYWPAFNIADSAITVGAVLLVLAQMTEIHRKKD